MPAPDNVSISLLTKWNFFLIKQPKIIHKYFKFSNLLLCYNLLYVLDILFHTRGAYEKKNTRTA